MKKLHLASAFFFAVFLNQSVYAATCPVDAWYASTIVPEWNISPLDKAYVEILRTPCVDKLYYGDSERNGLLVKDVASCVSLIPPPSGITWEGVTYNADEFLGCAVTNWAGGTGMSVSVTCRYNMIANNSLPSRHAVAVLTVGDSRCPTCPGGQVPTEYGACLPASLQPQKNNKPCPVANASARMTAGNPIQVAMGDKLHAETDFSSPANRQLRFTRYYTSAKRWESGPLGRHWRHTYSRSLVTSADGQTVTAIRTDGNRYTFTYSSGTWTGEPDVALQLHQDGDQRRLTEGTLDETYDAQGRLVSLSGPGQPTVSLSYNAAGQLSRVTDAFGPQLELAYDSAGQLIQLTTPEGTATYTYNERGLLTRVTTAAGEKQYLYESTRLPHAMTGILDENGQRYATYGYDSKGRAILTAHSDGAEQVDLTYNNDGTISAREATGSTRTYLFNILHGVAKPAQITHSDGVERFTYDANGYLASKTDKNSITTTYVHDAQGRELSRTEAVGTPEARTITTDWHSQWRLPVRITEPGKVTSFTYDDKGRLLGRAETAAP